MVSLFSWFRSPGWPRLLWPGYLVSTCTVSCIRGTETIHTCAKLSTASWKLHQGCRDTGYNNTCCSSVAQSCPTLCNPMDCSTPGFPVLHPLPELAQTHVHPTISSSVVPFSSCPQSFPASGSFPMSQLFTSGGHSIGALASASVLLMNIQDWFPLGWTGLISLPSNTNNNLTQHLLSNRHSVHLIFHLWAKVYTFLKWGGGVWTR